jgi:hypothetical protein
MTYPYWLDMTQRWLFLSRQWRSLRLNPHRGILNNVLHQLLIEVRLREYWWWWRSLRQFLWILFSFHHRLLFRNSWAVFSSCSHGSLMIASWVAFWSYNSWIFISWDLPQCWKSSIFCLYFSGTLLTCLSWRSWQISSHSAAKAWWAA